MNYFNGFSKGWKAAAAAMLVAAAFVFAACDQGLSGSSGKGTLTINLELSDSTAASQNTLRTIYPDFDDEYANYITKYKLSFNPVVGEQYITEGTSTTISLPVNTYTITAAAIKTFDEVDTEIATGTVEGVVVAAGGNSQATITLGPVTDGAPAKGTFKYGLDLTGVTGLDNDKGTLTITPYAGGNSTIIDLIQGTSRTYEAKLDPGYYYVSLSLTKDGGAKKPLTFTHEILHIYPGLDSVFNDERFQTYTNEDFGDALLVTQLALAGYFTGPAAGAAPAAELSGPTQYTGTITSWSPAVDTVFLGNTAYTANVTLEPEASYTFAGVNLEGLSYAGATVSAAKLEDNQTVTLEVTFGATNAVSEYALASYFAAPVVGAAPAAALAEPTQYTGAIAWSPTVSGVFAGTTSYTATVTLTAATGYTFAGLTETDLFSYSGATSVVNGAGSGSTIVVTVVFPATGTQSGSQILKVGFGHGQIEVTNYKDSLTVAKGGSVTLSITGYTDPAWYLDDSAVALTTEDGVSGNGLSITLAGDDYDLGDHLLTVTGVKSGKPYSRILEFTVTEEEEKVSFTFDTIASISTYLAEKLENTEETYYTLKFTGTTLFPTANGTANYVGLRDTIKDSGKYVALDFSQVVHNKANLLGGSSPNGSHFNTLKSCTTLVGVIFPSSGSLTDGFYKLGSHLFYDMQYLKWIDIPANITTINGTDVFGGNVNSHWCGIKKIILRGELTDYTSFDFVPRGYSSGSETLKGAYTTAKNNRTGTGIYEYNGTSWARTGDVPD
jgi:hypothetical protein